LSDPVAVGLKLGDPDGSRVAEPTRVALGIRKDLLYLIGVGVTHECEDVIADIWGPKTRNDTGGGQLSGGVWPKTFEPIAATNRHLNS
jgi:hypothetical protein